MYDIAIIGSGPAGVSAAINAKILGKKFLWFGTNQISKKVSLAERIENYPGLPSVTGQELSWAFKNHADSMDIELIDEVITGIYDLGGKFALINSDNKDYEVKSVILCIGVSGGKGIKGEEEFLGRGVSYCATCDGNLYRGKNIAVICTDKRFEGEVKFLSEIASSCKVIPLYRDYKLPETAEIILKAPQELLGDKRVEKLKFKDETIAVDGVFILKSSFSPTTLLHGLKVEEGHIVVDRTMSTNIKGIFAAGDCVGRPYQFAKSVGEGNVALHSCVDFLNNKE